MQNCQKERGKSMRMEDDKKGRQRLKANGDGKDTKLHYYMHVLFPYANGHVLNQNENIWAINMRQKETHEQPRLGDVCRREGA